MLRKNFPGRKYERRVNAIAIVQASIEQDKADLDKFVKDMENMSKMNVLEYNTHYGMDTLTKEDLDYSIESLKTVILIVQKRLAASYLTIKNTQAKLGTKDHTHTKKSRVGKGKLAYN